MFGAAGKGRSRSARRNSSRSNPGDEAGDGQAANGNEEGEAEELEEIEKARRKLERENAERIRKLEKLKEEEKASQKAANPGMLLAQSCAISLLGHLAGATTCFCGFSSAIEPS